MSSHYHAFELLRTAAVYLTVRQGQRSNNHLSKSPRMTKTPLAFPDGLCQQLESTGARTKKPGPARRPIPVGAVVQQTEAR